MSVEKVNKRKEEKKNRPKLEMSRKRKQKITSVVCIVLVALMIVSPVLIYVADVANRSVNTSSNGNDVQLASGSDVQVLDQNGNVIGYMDSDGNIQYFDNANISTASDATTSNVAVVDVENAESTETIFDDAGNEIGHRHADGTEHLNQ